MMETTYFLAKLIGLMFLIGGVFLLINKDRAKILVDSLHAQPALVMVTGMINVLLGLLILLFHPYWKADWPILITLVGCLVLLKGLLRLFTPIFNEQLTRKSVYGSGPIIWGAITAVLGAFLTYAGFTHLS